MSYIGDGSYHGLDDMKFCVFIPDLILLQCSKKCKYASGRKHSRSPPVVEYGDHREPDFWLPRSLESRKPMNNREAENGVETTFMRVQKPVNMYSQNQRSHSGAETIVVTTTCQAPNTSPRDDRDSPNSSSGGILINPSNQILQPPSSGHEKWNLPRENSFRHSQAMNHPNTCPRNRTSIDLDTIDEDLQSINTPSTLPDLCKDAHHSSLEKQSYNRHSSLPSNPTSLFVNNSNDNPKQLTSVCKTAIV